MSTQQNEDHLQVFPQGLPSPVSYQARQGEHGRGDTATRQHGRKDEEDGLDEFERILRAKWKKDPTLGPFVKDYAQFKDTQNPDLFSALIRCTVLSISVPPRMDSQWKAGTQSFSSELCSLRTFLGSGDLESVHICLLASKLPTKFDLKLPLRTRMFDSESQTERKREAPKKALVHVLSQEWALSDEVTQACLSTSAHSKPSLHLRLPSKKSAENVTTLSRNKPVKLRLQWFAQAPCYKSDIYTYVWQPHISDPVPRAAEIFVNRADSGPDNVLVLVNSTLEDVQSLVDCYDDNNRRLPLVNQSGPSASGSIAALIYEIYTLVIDDTSSFLRGASEHLAELALMGRAHPSAGKIQYLLHLDDCTRMSLSGLADALVLWHELRDSVKRDMLAPHQLSTPLAPGGSGESSVAASFDRRAENVHEDIEYLSQQLINMQARILDVRVMIKDQLDLSQMRRTYIFTIVLAIYVPFSFMSALFGMNLRNPLWYPAKAGNNKTDNATVPAPKTSLEAPIDALVDAISTSGPYLWSFKSYWYITAPVTIGTIILPVVAGAIFRMVLKAFKLYSSYLRWTLPFLCLGAVFASQTMLGTIYRFMIIPLGIFAFGKLIQVSITGSQQTVWCAFAALVAGMFFLDGITGYIPVVFLSLVWFSKDIKDFFKFRFRFLSVLRSYLSPLIRRLQRVPEYFNRHRMLQGIVFTCAYVGVVVPTVLFIPWPMDIVVFAVPFGILAFNRIIRSFKTKQRRLMWLAYTGLYGLSFFLDLSPIIKGDYGFVAWLPAIWLALVRIGPALFQSLNLAYRHWRRSGRAAETTTI